MEHTYKTAHIEKIRKESGRVTTYILDTTIQAKSGQYVMVWQPRVNEKPFGIACPNPLTLSIAHVGPFTELVKQWKVGDPVSFRGPFGTHFSPPTTGESLLIGGGYGVVPLFFLASELLSRKRDVTVVVGAKTESDLVYVDAFRSLGCTVEIATDDGSCGFKGFSTQLAQQLLEKRKYAYIATCGPEIMMRKITELAAQHTILCQVSMERHFKCGGMGLCGECSLPSGILVCKDGPVFDAGIVKRVGSDA